MRLFIAAELPIELSEALAETQAELRGCIHGRYVPPDQLHITLAFLGNVDAWRTDDAIAALVAGCATHNAFDVHLAQLGSFGRKNKATLWQGVEPNTALEHLAADVREQLTREGFSFDNKRFLPHVTLMRGADVSAGQLPMPTLAHGTVEHATLFSSDLSGTRPVYTPLHREKLHRDNW